MDIYPENYTGLFSVVLDDLVLAKEGLNILTENITKIIRICFRELLKIKEVEKISWNAAGWHSYKCSSCSRRK